MKSNHFWTVFKVAAKDTFFSTSKFFKFHRKNENAQEINGNVAKKVAGKIGLGILMLIGLGSLLINLIMSIFVLSKVAYQTNVHRELLSSLIICVQFLVLFLGSMTTLNFLYHSKDNQLLITLPIKNSTIFAVKFSLAYLSEVIISMLMGLPILITYGVALSISGANIGATYYILSVLSLFILPIIPLLLISILSIPLMYFVSYLKKRVVAKALVVSIFSIVFLAIFFLGIFGMQGMSGVEGEVTPNLSGSLAPILKIGSSVGLVNYFLIKAMLNLQPLLNILIYLAILAVAFVLALLLSSAFYKKGIAVALEDSVSTNKKKKVDYDKNYEQTNIKKSFMIKEAKTIISTPTLFMNSIIGVVLIPIMIIFFSSTFKSGENFLGGLYAVSFVCYLTSIVGSSTNMLSLFGFSLEGKNILMIKSLPITPKDLMWNKLIVSNIYSVVVSLVASTSYAIMTKSPYGIITGLLIFILLFSNGLAVSAIGLNSDIKNPNFRYKSLNELTKNNKKVLKPMLINMAIGFFYFILGIVLSVIISKNLLDNIVGYIIFFGASLTLNAIFASITIKKLTRTVETNFYAIEV